jgi:pSer/pThr/pTyr-binding forkhead associated (FHA) protein
MFDRVILRALSGEEEGRELVLENESKCILGRSRNCTYTLDDPRCLLSRHHCRIKVSDPHVRIQDLGSLNGTYVNGENIGHRIKGQSVEDAPYTELPEYPLWDGDIVQIGGRTFQVEFDPPPPESESEPRDQLELWTCDCAVI